METPEILIRQIIIPRSSEAPLAEGIKTPSVEQEESEVV